MRHSPDVQGMGLCASGPSLALPLPCPCSLWWPVSWFLAGTSGGRFCLKKRERRKGEDKVVLSHFFAAKGWACKGYISPWCWLLPDKPTVVQFLPGESTPRLQKHTSSLCFYKVVLIVISCCCSSLSPVGLLSSSTSCVTNVPAFSSLL